MDWPEGHSLPAAAHRRRYAPHRHPRPQTRPGLIAIKPAGLTHQPVPPNRSPNHEKKNELQETLWHHSRPG